MILPKLNINISEEIKQAWENYKKHFHYDEFSFMAGVEKGIWIAEKFYKEYDNAMQLDTAAKDKQIQDMQERLDKCKVALELIYKKHVDLHNHNAYPKTCTICREALEAIESTNSK